MWLQTPASWRRPSRGSEGFNSITDLINRMQSERPSEAEHKSRRDDELLKAGDEKVDLETEWRCTLAGLKKLFQHQASRQEVAEFRWTSTFSAQQRSMDTRRDDELKIFTTAREDLDPPSRTLRSQICPSTSRMCVASGNDEDGKSRKSIQIFVKMDGSRTVAMDVSQNDKVGDMMKRIPNGGDMYVTSGRVLRRSEELRSCGVSDGSTVEVMSRMRCGGRHKNKRAEAEKKTRQRRSSESRVRL